MKNLAYSSFADYAASAMKLAATHNVDTIESDIGVGEKKTTSAQFKNVLKERRLLALAMQMSFDGIIMGIPMETYVMLTTQFSKCAKLKMKISWEKICLNLSQNENVNEYLEFP